MNMVRMMLAALCVLSIGGLAPESAVAQQRVQAPLLPQFENVAKEAGVEIQHQSALQVEEMGSLMMGGATAADFNNDGWQDFFVIGGGKRADALFINQRDGTFEDRAVQAGLADLHVGSGAAAADYNNDGFVDIYVTSFGAPGNLQPGQHRLYRNNGDLTFTDVASEAGVNNTTAHHILDSEPTDGFGASFGDYDLDGDLDLFVAGWVLNSRSNRLFRNNGVDNSGDVTFTDVTVEVGIIDNGIRGFAPCFADMDGDRYPEMLLAADFSTTEYFINQSDGQTGRTFKLYAHHAEVNKEGNDMGSAVGDFNRDGLLDWYITAIYDGVGDGRGKGNKLFINQGNHLFEEIAKEAGVDDGGWGWGTVAVDLNHDGWLDLVETNGWPLPAYANVPSKVWINQGQNSFLEVAASTGFEHNVQGLGMLRLDYDNDGDQDIVVTSPNEILRLFRNDLISPSAVPVAETNWLRVELDTSANSKLAPHGIGSRVRIQAGGQYQYHFVAACSHYLSQSELTAHFGLGAASTVDEIRVEWPDGSVTTVANTVPNQTITITPASTPGQKQECGPAGGGKIPCVAFLPLLASPEVAGGSQ